MRFLLVLALLTPAHAEFRGLELPRPDGNVYLWPLNLHLGYGFITDTTRSAHAFVLGVDLASFAYNALLIDTALIRLDFRSSCGEGDCGIGADFLLGSRVAWAHYVGEDDVHQLSVGGVVGWGSVGEGFSSTPAGDGQLIVGPSLRYAAFGLGGVEIIGLLPVLGEVGEHRPFGVLINLVGLGSLVVALTTR